MICAPGSSRSHEDDELRKLAVDVFDRQVDSAGGDGLGPFALDIVLWKVLEETGLLTLSLSERAGGGGTLGQLGIVLREAGRSGALVPMAEAQLLAGWLLDKVGLALPKGTLTGTATRGLTSFSSGSGWQVQGQLDRVAWGASCEAVVAIAAGPSGDVIAVIPRGLGEWSCRTNLAGEPRDSLVLDFSSEHVAVIPLDQEVGPELRRRATLGRSCLMIGALESALELTVEHVGHREQFGRPLGRFQAVQQRIAANGRGSTGSRHGCRGRSSLG